MVVAFHAGLPVPGGFVGVDVFFAISGFVITSALAREWARFGRINLTQFYFRRFKRLAPALAATSAVSMIGTAALLSPDGVQQTAARTAIGAQPISANAVIERTTGGYFDAPADLNPLLNTWSLSVEEQFYLAFPALLFLGWVLARRSPTLKGLPFTLVCVITVLSLACVMSDARGIPVPHGASFLGFYSPLTRAWEFALGSLLALAVSQQRTVAKSIALPCGAAGVAMLLASLWLIDGSTRFPGPWTLVPVAGALLLLAPRPEGGTPISRVLASPPLVAVGDLSYSIYLWHWPLIVFAAALWPASQVAAISAAALSLAPAIASFRWVEQPIRRSHPSQGARVAFASLFLVLVPISLAAGVLFGGFQ